MIDSRHPEHDECALIVVLVDDDPTVVAVTSRILRDRGHTVHAYSSARAALDEWPDRVDVVVSDVYMPGMSGSEFFRAIRERLPRVPFLFLTAADDIPVVVELLRLGADDLVQKPVHPDSLLVRLQRVFDDAERRRRIERIELEHRLIALEKQKLASWRLLYATKDTRRTDQLIANLSRSINQSGGYMWLDLLESTIEPLDSDSFRVSRDVVEMVRSAATAQREVVEHITEIGRAASIDLGAEEVAVGEVSAWLDGYVGDSLRPLAAEHDRPLRVATRRGATDATGEPARRANRLRWSRDTVGAILHELVCNAIKYSPEDSPIDIGWGAAREGNRPFLEITVANRARTLTARDERGEPIIGVPYDYQELVFDLFFTIEAFPTPLAAERWSGGSGLYLARTYAGRLDGWISITTGIDHTAGVPVPRVTVATRFPILEGASQ